MSDSTETTTPQDISHSATRAPAWVWQGPGEPEALEQLEVDIGAPGDDEVLVATRAIGLNPVDWKFMAMDSELWQAGQIPGVDASGEVIACGANVRHVSPGDRIAVHTTLAGPGTFSKRLRVPARAVMRLPVTLGFNDAAAFPCPALTAWLAIDKLPVKAGRRLLITGASGSVGRWLIQLARQRDFHVIAAASEKRHADLKALGADETLTDAEQLDAPVYAVIDTVNGDHARKMTRHLGANGHIVCIQDRLEQAAAPAFDRAISQHEVALGALHWAGDDEDWARLVAAGEGLLEAIADGSLNQPAPCIEPFTALPDCLAELKSGERRALKFVITANE
ncbi:alcohol dehydrogenase catalytic domain-containing protein [Cobetia sp. LC6]|uniref:alcohol dehydrogenase catalytic domain-containing protein n=1 Tax=Cobetia sp. LC6 TaxID=3050947 RepID=UPI0025577152|nr:alcohol dehydrogenase catalytic domain-containing protein [Cobetia sp. LC6]MDL2191358.1 alcohol dehydrogenase catalytic domain-containing protein [Cobetia sp. LC6]